MTHPVACHATPKALKLLDASPDVFDIITYDTALLDILDFYLEAGLTGWEERGRR